MNSKIELNYNIKTYSKDLTNNINVSVPITIYNDYDNIKTSKNVKTQTQNKIVCEHNYNTIESNKMLAFSNISTNNFYDKTTTINAKKQKNNINPITKGVIFHNIMQNINLWFEDGKITKDIIQDIIENNGNNDADITESIIKNVTILVNTPLFQKYKNNIINAEFEFEISVPFHNNFLYGIIDCLVKNDEDEYEIWDWKTNNINDITELKYKYELQMLIYIYLLMKLYPNQNKYTARLISTELVSHNSDNWYYTTQKNKTDIDDIETELINVVNQNLISVSN